MPLVTTPGQLTHRAEFYHQLGSAIAAGVPLIQALEIIRGTAAARSLRAPLEQLIAQLHQGATFSEALRSPGTWMPEFDVALLSAGERSGRLDASLRLLSDYYAERARLLRSVLADLAYPAFVVHIAVLVFPPGAIKAALWDGEIAGFILSKLAILLPLYAVALFFAFVLQGRHSERWRGMMERLTRGIPVLGAAWQHLAIARLSAALEGLISAGVSIIEAWELAAAASGSPGLRRAVFGWRPSLLAGQTPAEMVQQSRAFPELFASLYHTGEISGRLDDTLRRLYKHYQDDASRKLHTLAQWMPRLIYLGIVLLVAYQVISFWTDYYGNLLKDF